MHITRRAPVLSATSSILCIWIIFSFSPTLSVHFERSAGRPVLEPVVGSAGLPGRSCQEVSERRIIAGKVPRVQAWDRFRLLASGGPELSRYARQIAAKVGRRWCQPEEAFGRQPKAVLQPGRRLRLAPTRRRPELRTARNH